MGDPVAIGDLAERLLALEARAGFAPVPIEVIGLRPGEKLREELTTQGLRLTARHRRLWVARQRAADLGAVRRVLERLRLAVDEGDARLALDLLVAAVPGYAPSDAATADTGRQSAPLRRLAWSESA